MFILKCIIIAILFGIVPFLLGNLVIYKCALWMKTGSLRYILGYFSELALFWCLCVPMSLFKISFSVLAVIYSVCLTILCVISAWLCCKTRQFCRSTFKNISFSLTRFEWAYLFLFLLLLGIQLYFAIFYESTIWSYDDYDYVVRSLDTITSDHMFLTDTVSGNTIPFSFKRVLNSWEIYIAYLSKISGFHVTTLTHTIIPAIFLLIAYQVYIYIAKCLFNQRENRLIFLCILAVAFIFGFYSPYSLTFRLLVTLWQGKAVLSAIVIPFLIAFLSQLYIKKDLKQIWLPLSVTSIAACSLTMMGSGMVIVVYALTTFILSVYRRRPAGIFYCICGCAIPAIQIFLYLVMR